MTGLIHNCLSIRVSSSGSEEAQLTENVFTTFLFGCIEVSLQRNVV